MHEFDRIVAIMNAEKCSAAPPVYMKITYFQCAIFTGMHCPVFLNKIKAIIQRNKDNHMNFLNAIFKLFNANEQWQYQFFSFASASLCFDPKLTHECLLEIENDKLIFKKDLLVLVKLFFAFGDIDTMSMDYLGVNMDDWHRLSNKYFLDKSDLVHIAWTYPFLAVMILGVYSAIERPIGTNMLWNYPGFRPEMRFLGLLGLVPRNGYEDYSGFIKALLHYTVLQVQKGFSLTSTIQSTQKPANEILRDVIGLARIIFHNEVSEYHSREAFFKCLNITAENMQIWADVFDQEYPEYWDVDLRYFNQTG